MIVDAALAHAVNLVARSYSATGLPGGKTAAEYAVEGRYSYVPSFAAAIIFSALFGLALVINVYQLFRHRAWFWWVMNFAVLSKHFQEIPRTFICVKLMANQWNWWDTSLEPGRSSTLMTSRFSSSRRS